jgi:hypothetical protein
VAYARELKSIGFDYVCVVSGAIDPVVPVQFAPNYQIPFAERIKREAGIATRGCGVSSNRPRPRRSSRPARPIWSRSRVPSLMTHDGDGMLPRRSGAQPSVPWQYQRLAPAQWPGHALRRGFGAPPARDPPNQPARPICRLSDKVERSILPANLSDMRRAERV